MIPPKIQALFEFIDYLDKVKAEYIEKYIPLCNDLEILDAQRRKLKPNENYADKQKYDIIQKEISEKFYPILSNIYKPVSEKLIDLNIWNGDKNYSSIWNMNIDTISKFKTNFTSDDVMQVMSYKEKYLAFRKETNSTFLCLELIFNELDEILKSLFEFFKDTPENEFDSFETKSIEVGSIEEVVRGFAENQGKYIKFSIPYENLCNGKEEAHIQGYFANIKNEIFMGDKIELGDIKSNSGDIVIGKGIRISHSLNGKKETVDKIEELIRLINQEQNISGDQRQSLLSNFDKVKEEVLEEKPDKLKILKWLLNTKEVLEILVLSHDVTEAVRWVYNNLNFVVASH